MIDRDVARALRARGWRLRAIGKRLGCSKEWVRQVVGPVPFCSCGRRIHRLDATRCSRCREKEVRQMKRVPCAWCGAPGGRKRAACKAHMGKWHYARYRDLHIACAKRHREKVKKESEARS